MRTLAALVCLFLLLGSASGQNAGRGIEVSDIDRGADPCTDFYAFANGSWRARNPIPASMPRWLRLSRVAGSGSKSLRRGGPGTVSNKTRRLSWRMAWSVVWTWRHSAMAVRSHWYCSRESATLTVLPFTLRVHW